MTNLSILKSTSIKKGRAKSKKTPKFGAGAIFKNCKKILKAKKIAGTIEQQLFINKQVFRFYTSRLN